MAGAVRLQGLLAVGRELGLPVALALLLLVEGVLLVVLVVGFGVFCVFRCQLRVAWFMRGEGGGRTAGALLEESSGARAEGGCPGRD